MKVMFLLLAEPLFFNTIFLAPTWLKGEACRQGLPAVGHLTTSTFSGCGRLRKSHKKSQIFWGPKSEQQSVYNNLFPIINNNRKIKSPLTKGNN